MRTDSADLFTGIQVVTPDILGRHSTVERMALAARERFGSAEGLAHRLKLTAAESLVLHYASRYSLRPVQVPPELYRLWFFLGGRGAGKTHAGSCASIEEAWRDPAARIVIVGPTYSEIVKNQIEGPSGILTLCPPWFFPRYEKARRKLTWPNGAQATWLPAVKPDKFRGHASSLIWADEIVAWERNPVEVFNECWRINRVRTARMRRMGLSARMLITTTPKPTPLFRRVLDEKTEGGMILARSSTFDNAANLDPKYVAQARRLMNTTEGRREFLGELRFDLDAALYRMVDWGKHRVLNVAAIKERPGKKLFDKVVVGVDPATGEKKTADLHGIVVEGIREEEDGMDHVYVLADLSMRSVEASAWAKAAVKALETWSPLATKAWIFAETNTGGSMVRQTIYTVKKCKVKTERARNSKAERAAPVSAHCEAGLIHMVGRHHKLEEQLSKFTGQEGGHGRDDRADAFAWPIYKYVVRQRKNAGALGTKEPEEDAEAEEADE